MDVSCKNARSRIKINHCVAIVLRKEGCQGDPGDFWMYENGYTLFQGFLSANSLCWWNNTLTSATKSLDYKGYMYPGALLVGSEACSLDILRTSWARRILQPPQGYQIVALEEIEECCSKPVTQTQWTPLPEAVCAVILRLSSQGKPAGIETIREYLYMVFPHVSPPSDEALYDTLAQLSTEKKLYHTSNGYFIVTPERRRSRSLSRSHKKKSEEVNNGKSILMSTDEALVMVHGEMATIRDGNVTHQCIQTNLADVISGGNASDKVLYARTDKQWSAISKNGDLKSTLRLWGSNRRIKRSYSTRTIAKNYAEIINGSDASSNDTSTTSNKASLFSRIFRKSKRSQQSQKGISDKSHPIEWFNSKAVHLLSVGTQTTQIKESILPYDNYENQSMHLPRSATLPRRRRYISGDLSTGSARNSRENSPAMTSKYSTNTLPRNSKLNKHLLKENSRKFNKISQNGTPPLEQKSIDLKSKSTTNSPKIPPKQNSFYLTTEVDYSNNNTTPLDTSGPSSIESQRSSMKTSGPSSMDSQKSSKNGIAKKESKIKSQSPKLSNNNSFILEVTTRQGKTNSNTKTNTKTTATISNSTGSNTKIFVQNSSVKSIITVENGDNIKDKTVIVDEAKNEDKDNIPTKNTNHFKDSVTNLNNKNVTLDNNEMNNARKMSLQMPSKENLDYNNIIKNVAQKYTSGSNFDSSKSMYEKDLLKNYIQTNSPTSSNDKDPFLTSNKIYADNLCHQKSLCHSLSLKNNTSVLGSEPNIFNKDPFTGANIENSTSLNDLTLNFTSLAAQKILKGISINSVDTLVELNMNEKIEKPKNGVIQTDFEIF